MIVAIVIIVLIAGAAWYAYSLLKTNLATQDAHQAIINDVNERSLPLSQEEKAAILDRFAADQKQADKQPDLSAEQKAAIMQNVAAGK
jgi:hypothetical protein